MHKAFALLILPLLILISGCTASTGNVAETTKLGMPETPAQSPLQETQETVEELHKEFEEFEKSQAANLSEQNETQDGAILEDQTETIQETEEMQNNTEESEAIPEEEIVVQNESVQKQCPSCEDSDSCTEDSCSEETDFECMHEPIIPCCGNGECEQAENWTTCMKDCECSLDCGPCETLENETCSCVPKIECIQDGCCPEGCTYLSDSDCSLPGITISEIYYNPPGNDNDHEWLEIYNSGAIEADITKLRLNEDEKNHTLKNITGAVLRPGLYAVIAENTTQFLADYPDFSGLLFDSAWSSLSNTGELISLVVEKDGILDSVLYNSTWGGNGFSLEKIDMSGPNTQENWNSSAAEGGTPGQKNSISI